MPESNEKPHFKGVALALLGVTAAVLGIFAVGVFGDHFDANPLYSAAKLSASLSIDVFGAVIPITVGLVCAVQFVRHKHSIIKLALCFAASVFSAFYLFRLTDVGVVGSSLLFAFAVSIAVAVVNSFPKPFADLKNKFASAVTLALACAPLSLLLVDLVYSLGFSSSVIGGNGLNDCILISTLYAPFGVLGAFSVVSYASQMARLLGSYQRFSKLEHSAGLKPTVSEESK